MGAWHAPKIAVAASQRIARDLEFCMSAPQVIRHRAGHQEHTRKISSRVSYLPWGATREPVRSRAYYRVPRAPAPGRSTQGSSAALTDVAQYLLLREIHDQGVLGTLTFRGGTAIRRVCAGAASRCWARFPNFPS